MLPTYARVDLAFERGEGAWLIATNGDRYLDLIERMRPRLKVHSLLAIGDGRGGIPRLGDLAAKAEPDETEAEVDELADFLRSARFERCGVFAYSLEPDTPAARLPDHLPEAVKEERQGRLMAAQQAVSAAWTAAQVGKRLDVILDQPVPKQKNVWVGRSHADAPDVDGVVRVRGGSFRPGDIVSCEIDDTEGYDLIARATPSEPPRSRKARPRPRRKPAASSLVILDDM